MQILVGFGFNSDEHLENDYDSIMKLSIIPFCYSNKDTVGWCGHSNTTVCKKKICLNILHTQAEGIPKLPLYLSHLVEFTLPIFSYSLLLLIVLASTAPVELIPLKNFFSCKDLGPKWFLCVPFKWKFVLDVQMSDFKWYDFVELCWEMQYCYLNPGPV